MIKNETWLIVFTVLTVVVFGLYFIVMAYDNYCDKQAAKLKAERLASFEKEKAPEPKMIQELDKSRLLEGRETTFVYEGYEGEWADFVVVD